MAARCIPAFEDRMAVRGFCEHGKIWTTCQICGKEVIAAHAGKRGGGGDDEFVEFRPKKRVVKPPPDEPGEAPEAAEEAES